ncbi:hypothetical protein B4168_1622 [Anoxybacillus flavithermus]|nr:hypothetical protein B4168_1622 [Anoxybacillus flavithermus]OAO84275.1 hypothetical protein GT23_3810 [Parageobacillus thermoglucosidasius]
MNLLVYTLKKPPLKMFCILKNAKNVPKKNIEIFDKKYDELMQK